MKLYGVLITFGAPWLAQVADLVLQNVSFAEVVLSKNPLLYGSKIYLRGDHLQFESPRHAEIAYDFLKRFRFYEEGSDG